MISIKEKIERFFTQQPLPHSALHLSSRYLSGIRVSPSDRKLKHHFIIPFPKEVITPSFHNKNIRDSAMLENIAQQGLAKLHISDPRIVLLLPELSQKTFVFSFDALPGAAKEREQIILFRIKKQIPVLPKDARLSYVMLKTNAKKKVLATIARSAVVKEYEDFFSRMRIKVKAVGVPSHCLYNLIDSDKERDFMLVDLESDAFSLLAIMDSEISLYRQKPIAADFLSAEVPKDQWMDIVQEIENTAKFIEDKAKRTMNCFWVRTGTFGSAENILSKLKDVCQCPVKTLESSVKAQLSLEEKKLLTPLLGQFS